MPRTIPPRARRVVFCPDSFKGSLSATEAAGALATGWASVRPGDDLVRIGQADGGEGTVEAVATAQPGGSWHDIPAIGPDGSPVTGRWYRLGDVAVCELAQVSGLPLMAKLDPLAATSRGLGQLVAHALASGCRQIQIGLGGSASTDGGAGALSALGFDLLDNRGRSLPDGGGALVGLASVRRPPVLSDAEITLVTDVTAPLLGPTGAAAVFGPQKGAGAAEIALLERGLGRLADLLGGDHTRPGSGAAGGIGYGFAQALGARIVDGAAWVSARTGLDAAVRDADLVVTGEGRFDRTSMTGKVVGHVLGVARDAGVDAQVVAGQVAEDVSATPPALSLTALAGSAEAAMADPVHWLEQAGARLASEL